MYSVPNARMNSMGISENINVTKMDNVRSVIRRRNYMHKHCRHYRISECILYYNVAVGKYLLSNAALNENDCRVYLSSYRTGHINYYIIYK